jgi:hypothetical protein
MTVDFESTPPMAPSNDEAIGGGIKRVTVDFESPPELPGSNEDYVHEVGPTGVCLPPFRLPFNSRLI